MRLQHESFVYIVNLCRIIVANYSRTSLRLSHPSEIGAKQSVGKRSVRNKTLKSRGALRFLRIVEIGENRGECKPDISDYYI